LSVRIMVILMYAEGGLIPDHPNELFVQFMEKMKGIPTQEANRVAAEFYLEHREEMLAKFSETKRAAREAEFEDLIREVSNYPELQEITRGKKKYLRKKKKWPKTQWERMASQIAIMTDESWFPTHIRDEFYALVRSHSNETKGMGSAQGRPKVFAQKLAEFYNTNREEILAAKRKTEEKGNEK